MLQFIFFIGYVTSSVYKEFNFYDENTTKRIEDFWKHASNESESLHKRIENGEHFLRDGAACGTANVNNLDMHYLCSNLGLKLDSLPDTSIIKVTEHYKYTNILSRLIKGLLYCNVTTLNNSLFLSFVFASNLVNQEFVDCFKENFNFLLTKII